MSLRDAWDEQAGNWAAWARTDEVDHAYWRHNLPFFLELVPRPGRLTLDVGCGEGRLGRLLHDRGHLVAAFDVSAAMARLAAAHDGSQPTAVADAAALPVRDSVADLVVAFMSLMDIDDMPGSVRECGRVLMPRGRLCLALVHPMNSAGRFDSEAADSPFRITGSYLENHRYRDDIERDGLRMTFQSAHRPLEAYSRALEDAGFVIEAVREHPLMTRTSRITPRWPVGSVSRCSSTSGPGGSDSRLQDRTFVR